MTTIFLDHIFLFLCVSYNFLLCARHFGWHTVKTRHCYLPLKRVGFAFSYQGINLVRLKPKLSPLSWALAKIFIKFFQTSTVSFHWTPWSLPPSCIGVNWGFRQSLYAHFGGPFFGFYLSKMSSFTICTSSPELHLMTPQTSKSDLPLLDSCCCSLRQKAYKIKYPLEKNCYL